MLCSSTSRLKLGQPELFRLSLKQGMGNRGIRESGNRGIRESGNRGIRESGNPGIGESGNRGIHPAVHTRLPMPIFKTGNPPCGAY